MANFWRQLLAHRGTRGLISLTSLTALALVIRFLRAWRRKITPLQVQCGSTLLDLHNPLRLSLYIGKCVECWTDDYLSRCLGGSKIQVHVSDTPYLNFANKNFKYEVVQFHEFLSRVQHSETEFLYYRSQHSKRNRASSLESIGLEHDFSLPPDLLSNFEIHSTVLRIASTGLSMWLHYDVCDNFLCCIRGRKRVVLFHPDNIGQLYISGSSSAVGSRFFTDDLPQLWKEFPLAEAAWTRRYEIELYAGDVLFLPAFWPHCTQALPNGADKASVSVNMFVLQKERMSLHDPKDVWANRELLPAQEAVKAFEEKVLPSLAKLPPIPRSFYCNKIAAQLYIQAQAAATDQDSL